jgi:hypothetical protein
MRNRESCQTDGAIAIFVLLFFTFPFATRAEVREVSLKVLIAKSEMIIVAKVSKLEDGPADIKPVEARYPAVKVATAGVIETWKGAKCGEVRFVASPTRYCDIADARVGERVVLFLEKLKGSTIMMIAHVGRGRMPVREVEGESYAMLPSEVRSPKGIKMSVKLSNLAQMVRENSR